MKSLPTRAFLPALFVALLFAGCVDDSTAPMPGNLAPVTFLSVQGSDLDTVNYHQVLRWWGSDPDGRVDSYLIRWDGGWTPPPEAPRWPADPSWIVTEATSDTFVLATNGTFAAHTFSVRAVDNEGLADPTGRTQRFALGNSLPQIRWSGDLARPEASLPAVAFAWAGTDPDGNRTVAGYRYWLERIEPQPAAGETLSTTATIVAIRPEDFASVPGPRAGRWALQVFAVDESGGRSTPIQHIWTVEEPAGDYLLIDQAPSWVAGYRLEDTFYRAMMDSIAAGNYHIHDVETAGNFRTPAEIAPLFSLFRGVVWYGGAVGDSRNDASVLANLQMADLGGGLRDYLEGGGRVMLAAHNAVGDSAGLSADFAREILGIEQFFRKDRDFDIGLPNRSTLQVDLAGTVDSLQNTSTMVRAEFFTVAADVVPLLTVPAGFLARVYPDQADEIDPDQSETPAVLAVESRRSGVIAVASFVPSRTNGFQNRDRVMAMLFRRLLLEP